MRCRRGRVAGWTSDGLERVRRRIESLIGVAKPLWNGSTCHVENELQVAMERRSAMTERKRCQA
jgi:hypothetical protein